MGDDEKRNPMMAARACAHALARRYARSEGKQAALEGALAAAAFGELSALRRIAGSGAKRLLLGPLSKCAPPRRAVGAGERGDEPVWEATGAHPSLSDLLAKLDASDAPLVVMMAEVAEGRDEAEVPIEELQARLKELLGNE